MPHTGPTNVYYGNGLREETRFIDMSMNIIHCDDGPAKTSYYESGEKSILVLEAWYRMNLVHRDGYPARIERYNNGDLKLIEWFQNGRRHREDGPAKIQYPSPEWNIFEITYWFKGIAYRDVKNDLEWQEQLKILRIQDVMES